MLGLTGGMGAGKSTVAGMLAEAGATVVDTDAVVRSLSEPGGAAHDRLLARFGTADRAELARAAFSDAQARADLNAILHPLVAAEVQRRIAAARHAAGVLVVEVPLLVEAGWEPMFDAVVVVDAPEDLAVERLAAGRGVDAAEARRRMATQATRAERLARADHVVVNDGSLADLRARVEGLLAGLRGAGGG